MTMKQPLHPDIAFRVIVIALAVIVLAALIREWVYTTPVEDDSAWPTRP